MNWKWLAGIGFLGLWSWSAAAADLGEGRISLVQGDVQIQPAGSSEWQLADVNVPVRNGDRFWCPETARLELEFHDNTIVRLNNKSEVDVLDLGEKNLQLHLSMGQLYFMSGQNPDTTFQVDVPDASMAGRGLARFRVDLDPDGSEDISIFQGSVQVAASGTKTQVRTGEMLSLENGSSEVSPLKVPDSWEQWNLARDQQHVNSIPTAAYLPPEMAGYSSDLSDNGEWVLVPGYGYCWYPSAGLSIGWAPYRFGHWVWLDDDYIWVSAEPWGWAPYHYGRWLFYSNRWCWVPPRHGEAHWGPGFVGWIHTPRYVGWVPLAPGEHFRRNENFRGEFHNLPFHNSATVVARSTFAAGRVVPISPGVNILAPGGHAVGFPDIRPAGQATHLGPSVPSNRLPGRGIRSLSVPQLREQHPVLHVVPPRPQRHSADLGNRAISGAGNPMAGYQPALPHPQSGPTLHAAGSPAPMWGNRSAQHMWWVSPRTPGSTGGMRTRSEGISVHGGGGEKMRHERP